MIIIKKRMLDNIVWSIFLFILIFNPPIVRHTNLYLAVFSFIIICTRYRYTAKAVIRKSHINLWILGIILLFLYVFTVPFIVSLFMGDILDISHYSALINRFAVLLVTIVPCSLLLLCRLEKKAYDYHFFLGIVINAGLLESFLVILSFLFPDIKSLFVDIMLKNTGSTLYENTWYVTVRSYGLAGTLVDLFGLGIAVLAGISFFYGVVYKRRYIIYSIFITVSALLNARTGVVLYVISIIFAIIYVIRQRDVKMLSRIITGLMLVFFISMGFLFLISKNSATLSWIQSLITGIQNVLVDKSTQNAGGGINKLFSKEFWELPGVVRTIIGTAHSKYLAEGYSHSDVGYINDIWFSGIIGCSILYGFLVKIVIYIYKNSKDVLFRFISMYILICFFVFNFKGAAYGYNPGAAAILTIVFGFCYYTSANK